MRHCIPEIKIVEFLAYGIHSHGLGTRIPSNNRPMRKQIDFNDTKYFKKQYWVSE